MDGKDGVEPWPEPEPELELRVHQRLPGRAVLIEPEGPIHLGRNYQIWRSDDGGDSFRQVTAFPLSPLRRLADVSRLACRLLRQEVRALVRLSDGSYVGANREGLFHAAPGDAVMTESRVECGDQPMRPPMRLSTGPDDLVIGGEYCSAKAGRDVRILASKDRGESFQVVQALPAGTVGHVHNVVYDAGRDHYWVLLGDHGDHAGIGILSSDLARFEWYVRGKQSFRAVEVFDLGDRLVYATDTEVAAVELIVLEKDGGRYEALRRFEGSCIYACRFGDLYALSTTVEPSSVNQCSRAGLWVSRDALDWKLAYSAPKDVWSPRYLQYGSIVLPCGASDSSRLFFSGQAVSGLDGRTLVADVVDGGAR